MVSLIVDNDREWGNLADMLDALSTAADLAVFAEQHDEVDSMLRPLEASNVKPPYQQRLVTALAHVISSGLHLVCALEGSMLQPMPAAAVSCLCCCIDTYTALGSAIKKAGGIKGTKSSLQDVTDSGTHARALQQLRSGFLFCCKLGGLQMGSQTKHTSTVHTRHLQSVENSSSVMC